MSFNSQQVRWCAAIAVALSMLDGARPFASPRPDQEREDHESFSRHVLLIRVVYTGSLKKQAEHGGFAHDDTNVMLLVSNPNIHAKTVTSFVETTQVASTILRILGLDPRSLDAVRKEGTPVLPGLNFEN